MTDPVPFITAAYLIGMLLIVGFATWIQWHRQKIKRTLSLIQP